MEEGMGINSLPHVKETVLKKRKNNEEWAIKRRSQIESRRQKRKDDAKGRIKTPEEFIKKYRDRELDLIQMKTRLKVRKTHDVIPESRLLFAVRLHNPSSMHSITKKLLTRLRLNRVFSGVFLKVNDTTMNMLLRVEPYVTYGYPSLKSVRELIFKKGCGRIKKDETPLTDNLVVERALGKYGVICIEDVVHEIAMVGPHFNEVSNFLMPFKLKRPAGRFLQNTRLNFKDGGDVGNREDHINELISKMN